jgi:hypothetical protein
MQLSPYGFLSYLVIIQALLMQGIWLYLGRFARNRYLTDIMHFREPSSTLSRYYDWRIASFVNALVEGVVFLIVLLCSLILLSVALGGIALFFDVILYVMFVMFLSLLSSLQMAWRVREINERENRIITSIGTSTDKVGVAKEIVETLMVQGSMGDGRVWFALYRLAQRPNQAGWAIRDVLIEKGREMRDMLQYSRSDSEQTSSDKGPGIET